MAGRAFEDTFGLVGHLLDGQYRAEAVVGEGGFGVVYRGRHLALDQPIAIKILKGLDGGDPRVNALVLEKFRAEARLLYTLSQSSLHIVRSLHYGAAAMPNGVWAPYMILEWLEGRSLADDLRERQRAGGRGRSLAEALTLLEPIAAGLSVAHRQRIAHRDIKPANVFLLSDPSGPRVKLLDFGIAKIMKEGEAAGTKGTLASFTWLYAAPEQLDPRRGPTGLATDVYAFALLATEVLTDRPPIEDADVVSIMRTATDPTRRPSPRSRGANVPDPVEQILVKALAVDPGQRWPSIVELWDALSRARAATGMLPAAPSSRAGVPAAVPAPAYGPPPHTGPPRTAPPYSAPAHHVGTAPPASPPMGTPPPGWQPTAAPAPTRGPMPYVLGWLPQRRMEERTNPWFVGVIVLVTIFAVFTGSCAMCGACASLSGQ